MKKKTKHEQRINEIYVKYLAPPHTYIAEILPFQFVLISHQMPTLLRSFSFHASCIIYHFCCVFRIHTYSKYSTIRILVVQYAYIEEHCHSVTFIVFFDCCKWLLHTNLMSSFINRTRRTLTTQNMNVLNAQKMILTFFSMKLARAFTPHAKENVNKKSIKKITSVF